MEWGPVLRGKKKNFNTPRWAKPEQGGNGLKPRLPTPREKKKIQRKKERCMGEKSKGGTDPPP